MCFFVLFLAIQFSLPSSLPIICPYSLFWIFFSPRYSSMPGFNFFAQFPCFQELLPCKLSCFCIVILYKNRMHVQPARVVQQLLAARKKQCSCPMHPTSVSASVKFFIFFEFFLSLHWWRVGDRLGGGVGVTAGSSSSNWRILVITSEHMYMFWRGSESNLQG